MAFFTLNNKGEGVATAGTDESLSETVVSPSHFFIINNTGSAVRFKIDNSAIDTSRNASGHQPAHNVHADGSITVQASSHVTMISDSGGTGGVIDVTLSDVQATHATSAVNGEHMYIAKDANATQPSP